MESDKPKIKISAEVRQRRKEIREQAKAMLLGQVLSHPYFPHDIYKCFWYKRMAEPAA